MSEEGEEGRKREGEKDPCSLSHIHDLLSAERRRRATGGKEISREVRCEKGTNP